MTTETSKAPEPAPLSKAVRDLGRCAVRTCMFVAQHRLHQPAGNVGREMTFGDASQAAVYRETTVDQSDPARPAVLVVGFRLRRVRRPWAHWAFRRESLLNTVLFAGFAGFVSKLWLRQDENGLYRGIYQWDGADQAEAYVRSLWWALALVSDRDSIRYAVLPGLHRAEFVDVASTLELSPLSRSSGPQFWWQPIASSARRAPRRSKVAFDPTATGIPGSRVRNGVGSRFDGRVRSA